MSINNQLSFGPISSIDTMVCGNNRLHVNDAKNIELLEKKEYDKATLLEVDVNYKELCLRADEIKLIKMKKSTIIDLYKESLAIYTYLHINFTLLEEEYRLKLIDKAIHIHDVIISNIKKHNILNNDDNIEYNNIIKTKYEEIKKISYDDFININIYELITDMLERTYNTLAYYYTEHKTDTKKEIYKKKESKIYADIKANNIEQQIEKLKIFIEDIKGIKNNPSKDRIDFLYDRCIKSSIFIKKIIKYIIKCKQIYETYQDFIETNLIMNATSSEYIDNFREFYKEDMKKNKKKLRKLFNNKDDIQENDIKEKVKELLGIALEELEKIPIKIKYLKYKQKYIKLKELHGL